MDKSLLKTESPGYMRDPVTQAIINTNEHEYTAYKERVKQALELKKVKNEIDVIHKDLSEMKDLLRSIAKAVNNG